MILSLSLSLLLFSSLSLYLSLFLLLSLPNRPSPLPSCPPASRWPWDRPGTENSRGVSCRCCLSLVDVFCLFFLLLLFLLLFFLTRLFFLMVFFRSPLVAGSLPLVWSWTCQPEEDCLFGNRDKKEQDKVNYAVFEKEGGATGVTTLTRMRGCTGLYWTALAYTGLHWTLLDCTGLYWAVLGSN